MKRHQFLCCAIFLCVAAAGTLGGCAPEESMAQLAYLMPEERAEDKTADVPEKNQPPEPGEIVEQYITHINFYADCTVNPPEMATAKKYQAEPLCSRIVAAAMTNLDGHAWEEATPFDWYVADTQAIKLMCADEPWLNLCWPVGQQDVFDLNTGDEPETTVAVCTQNICPEPLPPDCENVVCRSIQVKVTVNLQGSWQMSDQPALNAGPMNLVQDGRNFSDSHLGLDHGKVVADSVQFQIDDYLYTGQIDPGRNQMHGNIMEMMGMAVIGTWVAERVP